jgi:hypothetical protein
MDPTSEMWWVFPEGFESGDHVRSDAWIGPLVPRESLRCADKGSSQPGDPEDPWPARRIALRREYGGHEHELRALQRQVAHRGITTDLIRVLHRFCEWLTQVLPDVTKRRGPLEDKTK